MEPCWAHPTLPLAVPLSRAATPLRPGIPQRLGPDMWAGRLGRTSSTSSLRPASQSTSSRGLPQASLILRHPWGKESLHSHISLVPDSLSPGLCPLKLQGVTSPLLGWSFVVSITWSIPSRTPAWLPRETGSVRGRLFCSCVEHRCITAVTTDSLDPG